MGERGVDGRMEVEASRMGPSLCALLTRMIRRVNSLFRIARGAVLMLIVAGAVFRESFASKTSRIRAASPYGHLASWSVISVIVKTGADLRQEQLAIQLVKEFGRIWDEEKCPSWVR